jgi:hypothetical protein
VSGWWYPGLAVVSLGAACVLVAHCLAGRALREGGRSATAVHAVMAAAMAGMFWPAVGVVPAAAGAVVFGLLAAWFAVVRLRVGGRGVDEPTHLAIGSAAMVVMYLGTHAVAPAADGGGHAAHGGHAGGAGAGWLPAVVLALVLAGYFVWHAWETASAARPPTPAARHRRTPVLSRMRTVTAAHVVLDGLMAAMFLGAL